MLTSPHSSCACRQQMQCCVNNIVACCLDRNAMVFFTLYLQLIGMSDFSAALLYASYIALPPVPGCIKCALSIAVASQHTRHRPCLQAAHRYCTIDVIQQLALSQDHLQYRLSSSAAQHLAVCSVAGSATLPPASIPTTAALPRRSSASWLVSHSRWCCSRQVDVQLGDLALCNTPVSLSGLVTMQGMRIP